MTDAPCTFCEIAAGVLDADVVLAEERVVAFLDRSPVFPGHVLVVPRAHHDTLERLPIALVSTLFDAVQRVTVAVREAMDADGTWVSMNNTVSQSVPHLHVHVVPRRRRDGLRGFYWPRQKYPSDDARAQVASSIGARIVAR